MDALRRPWLLRTALLVLSLLVSGEDVLARDDRHSWSVDIDLSSASPSTEIPSWLNGGVGKLRIDDSNRRIGIGRIVAEYRGRITPTLHLHAVGDYLDDVSGGVDLTEAFLEWRPIPRSINRHRLKVGAFFPEISLENGDSAWTSPFSISSSAINTWIAEEVRTIGAEWSLTRPLNAQTRNQELRFIAAAYLGNDPAGTLLAWKGWSVHRRQTRLSDVLPLPALPQVGPGGLFQNQAVEAQPFIETDDSLGYYFGAEWRLNRRLLLSAMHYDNHADPMSLRDGQYGWTTRFDHLGFQVELPADFGLITQWIRGTTVMGPIVNSARVVDTSFGSYFMLLTRRIGRHRVSLRFDDFEVTDHDQIPLDDNGEVGHAWTLAYSFARSERLDVRLEWLSIETGRPSWGYFGLPAVATERLLQLQLRLRFGTGLD